jgi:hypothetical protein
LWVAFQRTKIFYVVVGSINTNLGSLCSLNGSVGEDKLKCRVINSGEVARSRRLVFLRAECKGVNIDTLIRVSGVGLVRLDPREVGSFTLREAVLSVKLELSGDDRVLSPTVHVKGGLREDKGAGIGDTRVVLVGTSVGNEGSDLSRCSLWDRAVLTTKVRLVVRVGRTVPVSSETTSRDVVKGTRILEETTGINVGARVSGNGSRTSEGVDGVRKGINGVGVVERLGTKDLEEEGITGQRRAIVHVLVRLDNPDKLLNGVVKVELDLVG